MDIEKLALFKHFLSFIGSKVKLVIIMSLQQKIIVILLKCLLDIVSGPRNERSKYKVAV